jgi:hypothetical protein
MWRRAAEGRMAEVAGASAVPQDRPGAAAQIPRAIRRPRMDQLSPRRQADLHGVLTRRQRLHRTAQGSAPGRIRRDRESSPSRGPSSSSSAAGVSLGRDQRTAARPQRRAVRRRRRKPRREPPIRPTRSRSPNGFDSLDRLAGRRR